MKVLFLAFWFGLASAPADHIPSLDRRIVLPGVEGRLDHLALDSRGDRLFVAALGNNTVEVIDLKRGRTEGIGGLAEPQGLYYDETAGHLLVTLGGGGSLREFDCSPGKPHCESLAATGSLPDADNIRRDLRNRNVLVGYGNGALAIFSDRNLTGTVRLGGHPESFQLEAGSPRLYVNVPDAHKIVVVDRERGSTVATWPIVGREANFPMALDEAHHRLLVGFRQPAQLVVFDTVTGKEVSDVACVGDTDDVFYDPASRLVYVSGGEGFLDVFTQTRPDRYERLARIPTREGARTSLLDAKGGRFFVAAPRRGSTPAEIWVFKTH